MARGSELIEKLLTVVIVLVMLDALYPALAQKPASRGCLCAPSLLDVGDVPVGFAAKGSFTARQA